MGAWTPPPPQGTKIQYNTRTNVRDKDPNPMGLLVYFEAILEAVQGCNHRTSVLTVGLEGS